MNKVLLVFALLFCAVDVHAEENKTVKEFLPKVQAALDTQEKKFLTKEKIEVDDGMHPDASKCICKGTGRIVQGDDHVTPCKYHSKGQDDAKPVQTGNRKGYMKHRVLFFTASWCPPCQNFKNNVLPKLALNGITYGDDHTSDIRIMDIDNPVYKKYLQSLRFPNGSRIAMNVPCFVEVRNNKVVNVSHGGMNLETFLTRYNFEDTK